MKIPNLKSRGFTVLEFLFVLVVVMIVGAVVRSAVTSDTQKGEQKEQQEAVEQLSFPEPTNYVVDTSGVISNDVEAELIEKCKAFDEKAQVAVVTVPSTQPLEIEEYSIKLAEKWGVGHADKDNGVILLIATEDRRVKIEVGRGLEAVINDAKAGRILDDAVVPYLKRNDWDGGVKAGVEAIMEEVSKNG